MKPLSHTQGDIMDAIVELPKLDNPTKDNLEAFVSHVKETRGEGRGTGVLFKAVLSFRRANRIADEAWDQILRSVAYLNGERLQRKADTAQDTARKFFSLLSTTQLKAMCAIHDVDFDSYDDIDSIVDALVNAQGWNHEG